MCAEISEGITEIMYVYDRIFNCYSLYNCVVYSTDILYYVPFLELCFKVFFFFFFQYV